MKIIVLLILIFFNENIFAIENKVVLQSGKQLNCSKASKIENDNSLFCKNNDEDYFIKDSGYGSFTAFSNNGKNENNYESVKEINFSNGENFKNAYPLVNNSIPKTVGAIRIYNETIRSDLIDIKQEDYSKEANQILNKIVSSANEIITKNKEIENSVDNLIVNYNGEKVKCSKSSNTKDIACNLLSCEKNHENKIILPFYKDGQTSMYVFDKNGFYKKNKIQIYTQKKGQEYLLEEEIPLLENLNYSFEELLLHPMNESNELGMFAKCREGIFKETIEQFKLSKEVFRKQMYQRELMQVVFEGNGLVSSKFIEKTGVPSNCQEEKIIEKYAPEKLNPIDLVEAEKIFEDVKNMKDIAYKHLPDGCAERAFIISERLKDRGINTNKIWLTGNLGPKNLRGSWPMHVAPYFEVKVGSEIKKMVIDPAVSDKLISEEEWIKLVKRENPGGVIQTHFPPPINANAYGKMTISYSNSDQLYHSASGWVPKTYEEKKREAEKKNAAYMTKTKNNTIVIGDINSNEF